MTLPGETAVVIRAGAARDPEALRDGLRELAAKGEPVRLSVFAAPYDPPPMDQALEEVCRLAKARWGQIQVSTVQRLRREGFELLDERSPREASCHFHIAFTSEVTHLEAAHFIQCFDEPIPNPIPRDERKSL